MARDLLWPIQLAGTGQVKTIEQNTLAEVQQGVDLVMSVLVGSLPHHSTFGRPNLAFATDLEQAVRRTIVDQCPRVAAYELTVTADAQVLVKVTSVATFDTESVVL